jgi:hypothetical protein
MTSSSLLLGFIFCEDEDLPEACSSWSGQSDEFRKAPPANVIVHAIYAWSLLDWVVFSRAHPCFYSDRLVLEGVAQISVPCCHQMTFRSMVKSEMRNIMKAGLED